MYSCDFCESARDCHQILENRLTLSILASSVILPYLLITYIYSQYLNKWAVFLLPVFCAHREIIFFHLSKKTTNQKGAIVRLFTGAKMEPAILQKRGTHNT